MGTIEWGWFFFTHQRVVNAAREGARAGTLQPPDTTDGVIETRAEDAAYDYLEAVGLDGDVATITGDSPITMSDGSSAVQLQITYPYQSLTNFPGIASLIPSQFTYVAVMRLQ